MAYFPHGRIVIASWSLTVLVLIVVVPASVSLVQVFVVLVIFLGFLLVVFFGFLLRHAVLAVFFQALVVFVPGVCAVFLLPFSALVVFVCVLVLDVVVPAQDALLQKIECHVIFNIK